MKNKEIEELLSKVKTILKTYKELKVEPTLCEELITTGELSLLLSYIEQLEKKIDQYENPEDLTLFYMWLDTRAKDKMKQMENEIINLKQQNQIITELGEQLENNRDKAIEYIHNYFVLGADSEFVNKLEIILKGDSDE